MEAKQDWRVKGLCFAFPALWLLRLLLLVSLKHILEPSSVRGFNPSGNDRTISRLARIVQNARLHAWSKIVEFNARTETTDHDIGGGPTGHYDGHDVKDFANEFPYDLTSPREWLEFCERQSGYPGAYTVLRCDFIVDEKEGWKLWGIDFHLHRLQKSFCSLLQTAPQDDSNVSLQKPHPTEKDLAAARECTKIAIRSLLDEAKSVIGGLNVGAGSVVVAMVTLLWEPHIDVDNGINGIRVRAHAFSNLDASNSKPVNNPNPSVKVVVGCLPTSNLEASNESMVLPNRYEGFPNAKLSSWCRQRRLLEELFKGADMGDVILTKSDVDSGSPHCVKGLSSGTIELLEGLTSNIFVVGPGYIIRTPPSSLVLEGYARQLVMDVAVKCGYRVEICPILLEGLPSWEDVFLTSSIRLIIPVQVMLLPSDHPSSDPSTPMQFDTVWERPSHHDDGSLLACHVLYREICRQREGRGC